jgi:hypothetical protein
MSNLIALVGSSGTGKSTSMFPNKEVGIKGLNPNETVFINVAAKPLPARGIGKLYDFNKKISEGGNYISTNDSKVINLIIDLVNEKRNEIKNIVIDDLGLMMSLDAMSQAQTKGFDKFVTMAVNIFSILNKARQCRNDLNVICTFHQERGDDGLNKIRTLGKMLDSQVYLDSLFTFILYSQVVINSKTNEIEYKFQTKSDGTSTCKSPVGCFDDVYIPNDMGIVVEQINQYYA